MFGGLTVVDNYLLILSPGTLHLLQRLGCAFDTGLDGIIKGCSSKMSRFQLPV
jgi:hypothetical protein